jgi:hypothetical protein
MRDNPSALRPKDGRFGDRPTGDDGFLVEMRRVG